MGRFMNKINYSVASRVFLMLRYKSINPHCALVPKISVGWRQKDIAIEVNHYLPIAAAK
jgi:hypothetical protein